MSLRIPKACLPVVLFPTLAFAAPPQVGWSNFESHPVHPIRLSNDGTKLLAVDTDAGRLSVFSLSNPSAPTLLQEIPVGMEPVSVRGRTSDEVWVVNSVSDSVSIVSLSQGAVVFTLATADEPRDVVFAGTPVRAYVSCGTARTLEVFDPVTRTHTATIQLDMWDPNALATSADGSTVYVLSRISGNRSSIVGPGSVLSGDDEKQFWQGDPLKPPPDVGFITSYDNASYSSVFSTFTLTDHDLALVSTSSATATYVSTVGTVNFDLAIRPSMSTPAVLHVTDTGSLNLTRFEPNLKGHFADSLLTPVTLGTTPSVGTAVDLNPGFNYAAGQTTTNVSTGVAQPMGLAFTANGATAYVCSFGSDRVLKLDMTSSPPSITRIEIRPGAAAEVDGSKMRGPVGLALKESANRLYVWNRVSRSVSVVNTLLGQVTLEMPLAGYHPVPAPIRNGRGHLYDAREGNGTQSCSSCHISSRTDGLAWDLGDNTINGQFVTVTTDTGPFELHPMKGPMATQTLQGLKDDEPFHWRGDRVDFNAFNPAFASLLGGVSLSNAAMQTYTDFIETVQFPANPHRTLADAEPTSLFGSPVDVAHGATLFSTKPVCPPSLSRTCVDCHAFPNGTNTVIQLEGSSEPFKTPQLRNMYEKGVIANASPAPGPFQTGFGYFHDGRVLGVLEFVTIFFLALSPPERAEVAAFVFCFPTGTAPAVGAMRTIDSTNFGSASIATDVSTLQSQATLGKCNLVAKGVVNGAFHGFWYDPSIVGTKKYTSDTTGLGPFSYSDFTGFARTQHPITFLGVAPGTGKRVGIDRDGDGVLDGNESPINAVTFFGSPTNGCCGTVTIGLSGDPYIGDRFTAAVSTGAPASGSGLFILGLVPDPGTLQNGVTIYVDLSDPDTTLTPISADETGTGVFQVATPDDPNIVGVSFHSQIVWTDAGGPQGLSASKRMTAVPYAP